LENKNKTTNDKNPNCRQKRSNKKMQIWSSNIMFRQLLVMRKIEQRVTNTMAFSIRLPLPSYVLKINCQEVNELNLLQDCQALLTANYCPRVAAVSCTHKHTHKTHVTLTFDLWPSYLKLLEVVKIHVYAQFYQAKCNGSWVIVLTEKKEKKT